MKKCPKCNRTYIDFDLFCNDCGVDLVYAQQTAASAPVKRTPVKSAPVNNPPVNNPPVNNNHAPEKKKGLLWWQILIIVATSVILVIAIAFSAVFIVDMLNDGDSNHQVEDEDDEDDDVNGDVANDGDDNNNGDSFNNNSVEITTNKNEGNTTVQQPDNQNNTPPVNNGNNSTETVDLSTKDGVLKYYKDAHAMVLSDAKSVTRIFDNSTNYNGYLDAGGNSALAGVAKTLMGMFLKLSEEPIVYTGSSDIATYFPPANNSAAGLTADMISSYSISDSGDSYIVYLALNSSENNPDDGTKAAHLVNTVQLSDIENAAAGFFSFAGVRNEYIEPYITATIDKDTGRMTALHTVVPSYMKFDTVTVMSFINVENAGIGLQYEQKWTIQY